MKWGAKCPVCWSTAEEISCFQSYRSFECTRCGMFVLHADMVEDLASEPRFDAWHRLSAWLREQTAQRTIPQLGETRDQLRAWLPERGAREQLDLLLQLIEKAAGSYAEKAHLDLEETAVLLWARGAQEVNYLISALAEQQRVERLDRGDGARSSVRLRSAGLLHLEELAKSKVLNDQLFVAMWFPSEGDAEHANMLAAYKAGILPAIETAGYRPFRVDEAPITGDRIDARIMVDIRRSRALIADLTGHRPNVTFEAGFAEALGRPVLWSVREDYLAKLPFDVRQFPFLVWKSPAQIADELPARIEHRLGIRRAR